MDILEPENAQLKEQVAELSKYVVHDNGCGCSTAPNDEECCSCGLISALAWECETEQEGVYRREIPACDVTGDTLAIGPIPRTGGSE